MNISSGYGCGLLVGSTMSLFKREHKPHTTYHAYL